MVQLKDLTGEVFHSWVVIKRVDNSAAGLAMWQCDCRCGTSAVVAGTTLRNGTSKSCGCVTHKAIPHRQADPRYRGSTKQRSHEYNTWLMMKNRCNNPKNTSYENYGARGITVCDRWNDSFEMFLKDMGEGPEPKDDYSIDRKK